MAPYNDKYCISCDNRTQAGGMTFCKVKHCKRIPTKRKHVNAVEFIPEAGVLIVRTRYYPEVKEVILAHRDEDGRLFREVKE